VGPSKFLVVRCSSCKSRVLLYQKDGPRALIRMYVDRIYATKELAELKYSIGTKSELASIKCPNCNELLAVSTVYEKEKRLAF
jgi:ribosomal protein S27E